MKIPTITIMAALLLALPAAAGPPSCFSVCCEGFGADADGDGWADIPCDNCSTVYNPSQTDSDLDGCGNACDADFNQDGFVAISDFSILAANLNAPVPPPGTLDIAPDPPDGFVAIADFSVLASMLNGPPGPSGTTSGTTACP